MKTLLRLVVVLVLLSFEGSSQNILFTQATGTSFTGVWNGRTAFGDIDSDNDLDCIVTGLDNSGAMITHLYENFLSRIS